MEAISPWSRWTHSIFCCFTHQIYSIYLCIFSYFYLNSINAHAWYCLTLFNPLYSSVVNHYLGGRFMAFKLIAIDGINERITLQIRMHMGHMKFVANLRLNCLLKTVLNVR